MGNWLGLWDEITNGRKGEEASAGSEAIIDRLASLIAYHIGSKEKKRKGREGLPTI